MRSADLSAKTPNDQLQSPNESIRIGMIGDYESTVKMIVSSSLKVRLIPNSNRIIQIAKLKGLSRSATDQISVKWT
jgi:hypothetical protein